MRTHTVTGHGGVRLHVRDTGPEDATAIMLIHGWSQHHLCWSKQMKGPLAERFRLVAPDLRGHGASDKPEPPVGYETSEPWAGDVAAIIGTLGLRKPILVGWSMGGWVIGDYLRHHGGGALGGVAFVGSRLIPVPGVKLRPEAAAEGMYSEDQPTALAACIDFVKACFAAPLSKRDLALMVGFNMLVDPRVRHACRTRGEDYSAELAGITVPVMLIQGAAERVCLTPFFEALTIALPEAEAHVYPGCGHGPFWENPERFNADLAAFAERAFRTAT